MAEFEYEIENFRNDLKISVHPRLVPFIRFTMIKNANYDFWTSFIEAFETLIECGASRDQDEARVFLDKLGNIPTQRAGRRCNHNIIFDRPMVLDDCTTQDLAISPLCFTVVDYGDLIPLSEQLQRIIGRTQKGERNQCVLLHLAAALVQSESASNRAPHPPPASRVKWLHGV